MYRIMVISLTCLILGGCSLLNEVEKKPEINIVPPEENQQISKVNTVSPEENQAPIERPDDTPIELPEEDIGVDNSHSIEVVSRTFRGKIMPEEFDVVYWFTMDLSFFEGEIGGSYTIDGESPVALHGDMAGDGLVYLEEMYPGKQAHNHIEGEFVESGLFKGSRAVWVDELAVYTEDNLIMQEINNNITDPNNIEGYYEFTERDNQYIQLLYMGDNKYKLEGYAYWTGGAPGNIHMGEIFGVVTYNNGAIIYNGEGKEANLGCEVKMDLKDNKIIATDNDLCGGANVTFNGEYSKISNGLIGWGDQGEGNSWEFGWYY